MPQNNQKKIIANTAYTMGGALLMNGVLQLMIYPLLNRSMGSSQLGVLLYIMGLVAVICPSVGQALNTSRLVVRRNFQVKNGDYDLLLLLFGGAGAAAVLLLTAWSGSVKGVGSAGLIVLLLMATTFRYYGDVEYRLNLNYKRYFCYYAVLSAGYAAGFLIYCASGNWFLVFLAGEAAALGYLAVTGTVFRGFFGRSPYLKLAFVRGGMLVFSYFITNLTLNMDRLVLKNMISDLAVTQYYVTSLIGKTMVLLVAPVNTLIISYLTNKNTRLNRRQFLVFSGTGLGVSLAFFLAAQIGTPLFVRLFYGDLYESVWELVTVVNISQILGLFSAYLFIVVLTFTEEKWQLILQIGHLILMVVLVAFLTGSHGIMGFSVAVLTANILRVAAVLLLGIWKAR